MRTAAPLERMARLPKPLRVWAARRAVARLKHERRSSAAIGTPVARPAERIPVVDRRDPDLTDRRTVARRAMERRTGERRAGVGSIEPRRTVGRRSELLPIDIALAERRSTKPVRAPVTGSRADPWAGALFLSALACSALLGHVVGEGTAGLSGAAISPPANDFGGLRQGYPVSSPGAPAAARQVSSGRFVRTPLGLGSALAGDSHPSGGTRVDDELAAARADPLWSELGQVQAEILRLRVLFRRLAKVAELDDSEFDLDLEPLELPAVRRAAEVLDLSIRALDPISLKSARMERIFDARRAAHDRRIGGQVAPGTVRSSGFGLRLGPFGGRRELHRGVDFAGRPGTPIHALADGIVAYSGLNGGYGNLVEIEHGDGYRTRYAHNQSNLVAVGDRVAKGDVVATLGSSGRSTGPHVHVEVRHAGRALDPAIHLR